MGSEGERIRLVIMGDREVGKTCLVRQFLFSTFQDKYKPTVEDLYSEDFNVGEASLKVDFLDTAGDDQFPVMRRLSISSGHAFLLVYDVTKPSSLELIQTRIEEIRQQRADYKELPIVLAGNKVDLVNNGGREIFLEDVIDWISYSIPSKRIQVVECSARDTYNVTEVFKTFLTLSHIPVSATHLSATSSMRRGLSAYAKILTPQQQGERLSLHKRIKSLKLPGHPNSRTSSESRLTPERSKTPTPTLTPPSLPPSVPSSPLTDVSQESPRTMTSPIFDFSFKSWKKGKDELTPRPAAAGEQDAETTGKLKGRSRSLIRRGSSKMRKKMTDAGSAAPDDCVVS